MKNKPIRTICLEEILKQLFPEETEASPQDFIIVKPTESDEKEAKESNQ